MTLQSYLSTIDIQVLRQYLLLPLFSYFQSTSIAYILDWMSWGLNSNMARNQSIQRNKWHRNFIIAAHQKCIHTHITQLQFLARNLPITTQKVTIWTYHIRNQQTQKIQVYLQFRNTHMNQEIQISVIQLQRLPRLIQICNVTSSNRLTVQHGSTFLIVLIFLMTMVKESCYGSSTEKIM